MAYIQITDLNPCESRLMDELTEELTDEELLAINGGKGGIISDALRNAADKIDKFGDKVGDFIKDLF